MTTLSRPNVCYGDHDVAVDNEILRSLVGSGVHGIAIEGTDDRDEMGIFIEPPEYVLGLTKDYDHHTHRSVPEGVRSGPDDVDLTIYSLRKWMRLAVHGNPTVLLPLYAPKDDLVLTTMLGDSLRDLAPAIVSKSAGRRFLGYLDAQHERMLGGGHQARVPKRPELIERYGFDVKYASHALRLGYQGVEMMQEGRLTLPLPPVLRERILNVKRGVYTFEDVLTLIRDQRERLVELLDSDSPLPDQPDLERINEWMRDAHLHWWQANSLA